MEILSVNFIYLLDLTRSSCKKCNYTPSGRKRICGPAIPVQRNWATEASCQALTASSCIYVLRWWQCSNQQGFVQARFYYRYLYTVVKTQNSMEFWSTIFLLLIIITVYFSQYEYIFSVYIQHAIKSLFFKVIHFRGGGLVELGCVFLKFNLLHKNGSSLKCLY
jgi:hypothetical protein